MAPVKKILKFNLIFAQCCSSNLARARSVATAVINRWASVLGGTHQETPVCDTPKILEPHRLSEHCTVVITPNFWTALVAISRNGVGLYDRSTLNLYIYKFFLTEAIPLCNNLLTYLLTPWCRVLLEKLTGLQLVKKFPAFHGT